MTRSRRPEPFRRLEDGRIALDLPPGIRDLMVAAAARLSETAASPGPSGSQGPFAPIDEGAVVDDPAYVLARQLMVDEVVSMVSASAQKEVIDTEEAEAWLKLLGMTLSLRAADLGIRTEDDRAALSVRDEAFLRVVYALQVGLIAAMDASGPA